MSEVQIQQKVLDIIKPFAKAPEAFANAGPALSILDDLKVNSARLVDIVLAFEDAFGIEINDDDADSVKTVGDAVSLIQAKIS
jgi:acyl carrier protein